MRVLMVLVVAMVPALMLPSLRSQARRADDGQSPRLSEIRRIHEEAIADPFNAEKFKAYLGSLPRMGNYYVVEGDMQFTADEVQVYLAAQSGAAAPAKKSQKELIVNLHGGRRDIYPVDQRHLTYAVDRASFPDVMAYETAVKAIGVAAKDWQQECDGCRIRFEHRAESDVNPSHDNVSFIVRMQEIPHAALRVFPA